MTRPRCRTNQRLATIAPNTRAIAPVPTPIGMPQRNHSCHAEVITRVRPAPSGDHGQRHRHHPADAEPLHQRGGEGGGEPVDDEVEADRTGRGRPRPAELLLQRLQQGTGRGAEPGRGHQGRHRDRRDPPRRAGCVRVSRLTAVVTRTSLGTHGRPAQCRAVPTCAGILPADPDALSRAGPGLQRRSMDEHGPGRTRSRSSGSRSPPWRWSAVRRDSRPLYDAGRAAGPPLRLLRRRPSARRRSAAREAAPPTCAASATRSARCRTRHRQLASPAARRGAAPSARLRRPLVGTAAQHSGVPTPCADLTIEGCDLEAERLRQELRSSTPGRADNRGGATSLDRGVNRAASEAQQAQSVIVALGREPLALELGHRALVPPRDRRHPRRRAARRARRASARRSRTGRWPATTCPPGGEPARPRPANSASTSRRLWCRVLVRGRGRWSTAPRPRRGRRGAPGTTRRRRRAPGRSWRRPRRAAPACGRRRAAHLQSDASYDGRLAARPRSPPPHAGADLDHDRRLATEHLGPAERRVVRPPRRGPPSRGGARPRTPAGKVNRLPRRE